MDGEGRGEGKGGWALAARPRGPRGGVRRALRRGRPGRRNLLRTLRTRFLELPLMQSRIAAALGRPPTWEGRAGQRQRRSDGMGQGRRSRSRSRAGRGGGWAPVRRGGQGRAAPPHGGGRGDKGGGAGTLGAALPPACLLRGKRAPGQRMRSSVEATEASTYEGDSDAATIGDWSDEGSDTELWAQGGWGLPMGR